MNEIVLAGRGARQRRPLLKRLLFSAAAGCGLGGLYAGRICHTWIRFTRLDMPLPDLPAAFEGHTLVHVSDIHCSPVVVDRYLRECIEHVNRQEPDFVALTGDFITGGTHYAQRVAVLLQGLRAKVARLACLGNHDYAVMHPRGHGHMRQLAGYLSRRLFDAGIHVLRNEHAIFQRDGQAIQFVGLEDPWAGQYDADAAFRDARRDLPTICLSHNPDTAPDLVERGAHWVLAGHTHGVGFGDNLFGDAILGEPRHFVGGYYNLGKGHLYVNRGLSYARRVNINKRPEITVFTLRRA